MMRKKVWLLIVAVALMVMVLGILYACESYDVDPIKKVGDKNAVVESNGGLVVKQGGYLYFVNGYSGYLTGKAEDNYYGHVTKGAIVRVTYNEDGTLGNDYTVVVPKSVMSSSSDFGFSIFGNYIYYVSPSTDEDRSGNVKTNILQFLRTKLDGTGTQLILNWNDNSVSYKYTSQALVYYDKSNSKIYTKTFKGKKDGFDPEKKGNVIASDVSSVYFLKNETFDPKNSNLVLSDYILYTKNATEDYEYGNTLYICDPNGNNTKVLLDSSKFESGSYSVSVIAAKAEGSKLALYYTKTSYGASSSGTSLGTFLYRFEDMNFAFDPNKEVRLSTEELSALVPLGYDEGAVKTGSRAVIYHVDGTFDLFDDLSLDTLICVENNNFYFLNSSYILLYYPLDGEAQNANVHYAYTTEEKFMSGFISAEYFDGYIYFILDDNYDYMARIKVADIDVYSGKDAVVERVAKMTSSDQKKFDAEQADED
ncbi:MAG TPA: hypothetical protein DHV31_00275 [Clostridiales bacterium]|nr:hypothetical protein [Clostridiales bacterium]